ncbi:MAG: ABC transporter ATP-binding protein [Bacteroidales bacterium]|nr:ABC transporter ATP-binding protein [Bacteroidales bacterium]
MRKYLKWFNKAVRPYRGSLAVMMLCHVLLTACSVGFVYASKKLVDVAVALLQGASVDSGLWTWTGVIILIVIVRIALNALKTYLQTTTEINLKNRLRRRLFDVLLHLQSDGGTKYHTGDLLNRMQEDVRVVSAAFASSIPNLLGTSLQFVAAFAFLMILDARLGLLIILVVPAGIFAGKYITGRIRGLTLDIRKSDSQVQSHLQESIQHIALLQTMEYTQISGASLEGLQGELYGNELKRVRFSILSRIFIALAFQAGSTAAFLWGVFGISKGTVTYGMMTAFMQLVAQIQRPLIEMSSQIPVVIHATASIDRIMDLESLPREEITDPVLLEGTAGIRISDVTFSYPDSSVNVLDGFSHDFRPGSRTAILGPTGAGKSTLIRLLLSLLKPKSGSIDVYNNIGVAPVSPATRCNLVYVPQGNSLFSGTICDNLLMGNPEATQEEMHKALHTAAADFVLDLPAGIHTQCFEAGGGLSEGQAQRIAIARALLRPGSILLLDEFSSALDASTETTLMERLTSELPDHTMIFITHRDKIIDYCTDILRLS